MSNPTVEEKEALQSWVLDWVRCHSQLTEIMNNDIKPLRKILKGNLDKIKEYVENYPQESPLSLGDHYMIESVVKEQCPFSKDTVSAHFKPADVDSFIQQNTIQKQQHRIKKRKRSVLPANQTNCTMKE